MALLPNADRLGIRLETAAAVILSHGHYDHVGGLAALARRAPGLRCIHHPAALQAKFQDREGKPERISLPPMEDGLLPEGLIGVPSREPIEVAPGIWALGEIPRLTDYEDVGGAFYLDAGLQQPDPLIDDQAVVVELPAGHVVVCGCAHAGVINTLKAVANRFGKRRLLGLAGGLHLEKASPERLRRTVEDLREFNPGWLAPVHCTGAAGIKVLQEAFPDRLRTIQVGDRLD